MITGAQIRAARAALRWTSEELAVECGITSRTIKRFEQEEGVPTGRSSTLFKVQKGLESAGIEFIGTPEDRPGIRVNSIAKQK